MVQAILQGRKTQTRRIIKKKYSNTDLEFKTDKYGTRLVERQNDVPKPVDHGNGKVTHRLTTYAEVKPKYKVGDVLWVRETYIIANDEKNKPQYYYKADNDVWNNYKPSLFMPRKAARIFLYVTNVRMERLRDITEADAIAEGFGKVITEKYEHPGWYINHLNNHHMFNAVDSFASMWVVLNGKGSWKENPYVWVYDFEVIEKPKDF